MLYYLIYVFAGGAPLKTDILGVGIDDLTLDEAIEAGAALMEESGFHYVVTPKPSSPP